ncbi:hypothetical protein [Kribbella shirazensis]|uniref:Uncharacterized protein n=1 Tax=Kribbella shirazensis TaxID=1105143 RepID=A0A7X5VGB8_9ACTN|nr:hypothetical protein [Kribbella shirazensis]NIK60735.1 hypothetical protein [Kribbella shirazensis]
MVTETTTGGFAGDPAEAFTPPSAGSCCGGSPTGQAAAESTGGCCGTDTAVQASSCCGSTPAAETPATNATAGGCCA